LEDSLRELEAASEQGAKRIQELAAADSRAQNYHRNCRGIALNFLATVAIVPALIYRN
jgi:hypothetical protein